MFSPKEDFTHISLSASLKVNYWNISHYLVFPGLSTLSFSDLFVSLDDAFVKQHEERVLRCSLLGTALWVVLCLQAIAKLRRLSKWSLTVFCLQNIWFWEQWNKLPRVAVESPPMDIFKTCLDAYLCNIL